jgi:hypothetical protein
MEKEFLKQHITFMDIVGLKTTKRIDELIELLLEEDECLAHVYHKYYIKNIICEEYNNYILYNNNDKAWVWKS